MLVQWFLICLGTNGNNYRCGKIIETISVICASTSITILLLVLFSFPFAEKAPKNGVLDFFIGDEGTYSLSRVQAVMWAIIIMSYQIATIISLSINTHGFYFSMFQLTFSESSVWLLGLSLSSYIVVKGITVNQISKNPKLYKRKISAPAWSDLVMGDNGLDFSRCQMLIWTVIAILVYESKCYYFLTELRIGNINHLAMLFSDTNPI